MSTRKKGENPEEDDAAEDAKKISSTGDTKEEDESDTTYVGPKELLDTKEDLQRIIVLLDKLDDRNVFQTNWKKDMQEIKDLVEKIDKSGIQDSEYTGNIAHKSIKMVTYGGRGNKYVDMWRLIGPDGYSAGVGQTSLFRRDDKGNLVQTMPKEPYLGDGNDYSPPRFHPYRIFIKKLIHDIDATIDEHIEFSPGGEGATAAKKEFSEATGKKTGGRRSRKRTRKKTRKRKRKRKTKKKRKRRKHRRKSKRTKR